jgi:hypothetical protein
MADTTVLQRGAAASCAIPAALTVKHCCAFDGGPLATVDGLPGGSASLRPEQLRALAGALIRAADDCETFPVSRDASRNVRTYAIKDATRHDVRCALDPVPYAAKPSTAPQEPQETDLTGREFIEREMRAGRIAEEESPALLAAFDAIDRQKGKAQQRPSRESLAVAADAASGLWFNLDEIDAVAYAIELVQEHGLDDAVRTGRIYALSRAVRELCGTAKNLHDTIETALRAA